MDWSEDTSAGGASADRSLWLAVVLQAVADGDAAFLRLANPNFIRVCALADIDPRYLLRKVQLAPTNEAPYERARLRQKQYNAKYQERFRRERVSA